MGRKIKKWTIRGLTITGLVGAGILINKLLEVGTIWCLDKVMETTEDW